MTLDRPTALAFAAILDDVVNQLHVLGKIMPVQLEDTAETDKIVKKEVITAIKQQLTTEEKLESVLSARATEIKEKKLVQELKDMMNLSIRGTEHTMKQSPLTKDNFMKIQADRKYLEDLLLKAQLELIEKNDFSVILDYVHLEKQNKLKIQSQIIKEGQGRDKIKHLAREIEEVKKEKDIETQHCNELIAHLKDQLQEMKAKSNMEAKYVKKSSENTVAQGQKRCLIAENKVLDKLEAIRLKIDSEERSHQEICNYLKKHQTLLEEKVEFWMEKFETDTEAKQHELNLLKTSKANDLERLHELLRKYSEYEKVVVHDRIEKEKLRRKKEEEQLELQSAVLLQAWWRGTMVVRKLGPFGKKKRKKKKGKKKKK